MSTLAPFVIGSSQRPAASDVISTPGHELNVRRAPSSTIGATWVVNLRCTVPDSFTYGPRPHTGGAIFAFTTLTAPAAVGTRPAPLASSVVMTQPGFVAI